MIFLISGKFTVFYAIFSFSIRNCPAVFLFHVFLPGYDTDICIMKLIACIMCFLMSPACVVFSAGTDSLLAVFWNLENFFDFTDGGGGSSDREFSPEGERRWTGGRYWRKCHSVAKSIIWISEKYGRMPDVMGFAEVENGSVLRSVIYGTALKKYGYVQIHADSPDPRGIDVALVYRKRLFRCAGWKTFPVSADMDGNRMATRDILYVCLEGSDEDRYHFLVNHHPSKYGGAAATAGKRIAAMNVMLHVCDSLSAAGENNIVCMGDFNDNPDGEALGLAGKRLVNLGKDLHERGEGTIRFSGKWDLIDMFLVSRDMESSAVMEICFPGFLAVRDNTCSGMKPLRTYTGPRYSGGISDHLPIIMIVKKD